MASQYSGPCPHCMDKVVPKRGDEIYPHRPDLSSKNFWECSGCKARVGCHPGTWKALGHVASDAERLNRQSAHRAFDPWWKERRMTRSAAYTKLSRGLNIPRENTHIGMFSVRQCKEVIKLMRIWEREAKENYCIDEQLLLN